MSENLLTRLWEIEPFARSIDRVETWWIRHLRAANLGAAPVDRAILGAAGMDRLGFAFACGYVEALSQLIPSIGTAKVALCVTERGGNHPRAIETRLDAEEDGGWRLTGQKSFVTLGTAADELLVAASKGTHEDGRNDLVLVDLPRRRAGIAVEPLSPTPFAPEIPHAQATFQDVRVEPQEVLEGDGYADYIKPFRTVEDSHVFAALLAWLLQVARRWSWPRSVQQELLALILTARGVGLEPPRSPTTHVALGGLITRSRLLIEEASDCWNLVDEAHASRWQRDRFLLDVAGKARARRLEVAWEQLKAEP